MKTRLTLLFSIVAVVATGLGAPASGQDLEACRSPETSEDDLEHLLKPCTKAQLEELATEWIAQVQTVETKVAAAEVAEDEEARAAAMEERAGMVGRAEAVLAELNAKGGDATEHETYLANLTSLAAAEEEIDTESVGGFVTSVTAWLTRYEETREDKTVRRGGVYYGIQILKFLAILLVFKIIAGIVGKLLEKALTKLKKASNLLRDFFVTSTKKIIMFVGFVIGLSVLGVDITPFLAAMGAAGFVIGFALQGTLSNFASGVMILVYRPYDIGDVVTAAGVTGKVSAMTLVSTTLLTPDNQVIIIPNGSIWGSVITNITANDTRRVDMTFGIGYEDDMGKAQQILEETLANHPKVIKDLGITVKVGELADSSVNFIARPWTKTADYWDVYWDLQREVKERFDAANISIPFPQQDIHVHGLAKTTTGK